MAFDGVEDVPFLAGGVEGGGEGVLLAGHPAFARVVYFGDVAGRGGDVGAIVELDEGLAVDEAFDVEGGEGDEVGFVVRGEGVDGVADLFDVNRAGDRGFLGVVALELV